MAYTLLKVTNCGIQIDGLSTSFPVIKAVIDGDTATKAEFNDLLQQIYDIASVTPMVAGCAPFCNVSADFSSYDFTSIPQGTTTYGNADGFQLKVSRPSQSNNYKYLSYHELLFKGNSCGRAQNVTGYSNYEAVYYVLFVDRNNYVYKSNSPSYITALDVLSVMNVGPSVINDAFVVAPVMAGQPLRNLGIYTNPSPLSRTGYDISDYITGEIDPGITDPYAQGGESGTGGGEGNFDGSSDPISIPGLPTLSAVDTGFITLFNPSVSQLQNLANYMWGSLFDLSTFKKLFADPMDCILGLSIVPVAVPNGGTKSVTVGNISTGVSMTVAGSQYVEVNCGTLNVNEFWGSYLDYDPYTKAEIYLPYIGARPIAVDDIMGEAVHVVYHVDILSGACNAYVQCGDSVLYTFIGQCSSSIPVTGNDWTNVINGVLSAGVAVGSMVATGGASAPLAIPALATTAVNQMKPSVEKSGAMSGTGGMLAVQTPYLILTRPRQCLPARQNEFSGYPSLVTMSLASCRGYTEIEQVHLDGIGCTETEMKEIENLLKAGVIF